MLPVRRLLFTAPLINVTASFGSILQLTAFLLVCPNMYRPASRALLRAAQGSLAPGRTVSGRRFLTTEPTHLRPRRWKSSALRWGLAIAGIYFYNTSSAFADQPIFSELRRSSPHSTVPIPPSCFCAECCLVDKRSYTDVFTRPHKRHR